MSGVGQKRAREAASSSCDSAGGPPTIATRKYAAPYRPGILLNEHDILVKAKRIAGEFNADFLDKVDKVKLQKSEQVLTAARLRLAELKAPKPSAAAEPSNGGEAAAAAKSVDDGFLPIEEVAGALLQSAAAADAVAVPPAPPESSSSDSESGDGSGDESDEEDDGRPTTIAAAQVAVAEAEAEVAEVRADVEQRFRSSMRVTVQRVTLERDASDINARRIAAGGSSEADVAFVQPPPLRCENCGNAEETLFVEEYKSGDVICARCGAVALEHAQYDGDWCRSFEGEESTSQVGPRPDPLLSTRYNLRTDMRLAPGVSAARLRDLRMAQDVIEMNQAAGDAVDEHRTREGYKDKQKRKAFERLQQVAERLQVSEATCGRAKAIFAAFRDNREHVQRFDDAVAACLLAAWEEVEYARRQADERDAEAAAHAEAAEAAAVAAAEASGGPGAAAYRAPVTSSSVFEGAAAGAGPSSSAASAATTTVFNARVDSAADAAALAANPAAAKRATARLAQARRKAAVLGYTRTAYLDLAGELAEERGFAAASGPKRAKLQAGGGVMAGEALSAEPAAADRRMTPVFELFGAAPTKGGKTQQQQQLAAGVLEGIYNDLANTELINPEVAERDEYKAPS